MNNKKLGNEFEREVVTLLSQKGYWVHFITPDARGSQPFDLIASKNDIPLVGDCKTSAKKWFNISRLEDNQVTAFELWLKRRNTKAYVFIKYEERVYAVPYLYLKEVKRINLEESKEYIIREDNC